jgi:hypothetical protein
VLGEEPPQRDARRRRNRHRNIRRHHEAGERDPTQPVSRDEASEMGETLDERTHREQRNSCRRDRRQAQEQERELAEQDCRRFDPGGGGVPGPTSKLSSCAPAQMGQRETEREGGKPEGDRRKGETRGLRVVPCPGRVRLQ